MSVYLKYGYKFLWKDEEGDSKVVKFFMYKINFYTALLKE